MAEIVDFGLQQYKIKMSGQFFENVFSVVAGDTARRLEIQLLDSDNMVQDTTGISLRLNAKVDGNLTYSDAVLTDAEKGIYQVDLANGMLLVPGNWQFQWQITDLSGYKLHSFTFKGNVGKNISEGGTEAKNFYLNLSDLKAMQADFVNGTIDSAILQTDIAAKLTTLEDEYAPKLTEVTAQLAQNETTNRRNAETPLFIPTYDGGNEVVHPSVVYFGNSWNGYKYWQAFTPYAKTNDKLENPSIAVSNDGVQWFIPSGFVNPIDIPSPTQLTDGYHMSDTELVYNSVTNKLECYYRLSKNNVIDTILRKTSSDGKIWSGREVVYETIGTQLTLSPTIYFNGSSYVMWFVQSYEGNLSIMRTTSTSATNGTWSTPTVCTLNYKKSSEGLVPWHIQVSYSKEKYHLVLNVAKNKGINSPTRILLLGESTDGITFNDLEVILEPTPRVTSMWDNVEIYRSSLVFNGLTYLLYYSALGTSGWKVGLLAGNTPRTLNSFNTKREVVGNELIEKSLIMNSGESLFLNKDKTAYIKNNELKFLIPGVTGGKIVLNTDGSYSFLNDVGNLNGISISKISSPSNTFGLLIEDKMRVVSTTKPATFKLVQTGVAGAGIRQTAEGYVEAITDGETTGHFIAKTYVLDVLGGSVGKKGAIGWDVNANRPIYNDGLSARALSNFKAVVPTTQTTTGVHGDYSVDVNNLYICTSTNNWKKIPLSAW